jgi:hypothetical protein
MIILFARSLQHSGSAGVINLLVKDQLFILIMQIDSATCSNETPEKFAKYFGRCIIIITKIITQKL